MRFKFKPQTGILVAGLLASTYAEACYYLGTGAVCVPSGTTVDLITWTSGGSAKSITASADWMVYSQAGYHLVTTGNGAGGYYGYTSDGGAALPSVCTGPVHFTDASGNTASVSSWSSGSIPGDGKSVSTPGGAGIYGGTTDDTSGTCE